MVQMIVESTLVTAFGGLAAVGVNVNFKRTQSGIVITRSGWDLWIIVFALIGFGLAPFYVMGIDGFRALTLGDFGGDRWFVLVSTPLVLLVAYLFMKSSLVRCPRAIVSRSAKSIEYHHLGYDKKRIEAKDFSSISVNRREGALHQGGVRPHAYAVTIVLKNETEIDIATHTNEQKMKALANLVTESLGI